jgi:hypothetical protein
MRLPAGPLLIVSPHLDDAVLSCAALLDRGEPAEVLTVFGGFPTPARQTRQDLAAGFLDSDEAMVTRHAEARNAFIDTPHTFTSMDLVPDQYVDGARGDREARWIARMIYDWLRRSRGGTVALPACAGSKPRWWRALRTRGPVQDLDHLYVRDAGLAALRPVQGVAVWLYEEYPHMVGARADREVRSLCSRLELRAGLGAFIVNRRQKARRLGLLRSRQMPLDWRAVARGLPVTERYWALAGR